MSNAIEEKYILKTLKEIHHKKGRDYVFKCRHIAKHLGISTYTLVRYIPRFEEQGIIELREKTAKCNVYKTCFEKDDKNE